MEPSEIIKHGQAIAACNGSQAVVDEWIKKIAQVTNTSLDWGYRAGRAIVYHVGDGKQRAIDELQKPEPGIKNVTIL